MCQNPAATAVNGNLKLCKCDLFQIKYFNKGYIVFVYNLKLDWNYVNVSSKLASDTSSTFFFEAKPEQKMIHAV